MVTIPVAKFDDGKEIAFFVVKAPDDSYRAAFDSFDPCSTSSIRGGPAPEKVPCFPSWAG